MPSEQEVIFEILEPLEVGAVLSYQEIEQATGKPISHCRPAVLRAGRQLLKQRNRLLRCEAKLGYRIARPEECTAVATRRHRAANRQLVQAREAVQYVDMTGLSPEQRAIAMGMFRTLAGMCAAIKHLGEKAKEHDQAVLELRDDQSDMETRIQRLEKLFGQK
ncbi:MAG: hypothetical protein H0U60_06460 [Blastocatellia bacterium]|nr:hypothetical protein [Blastocatellia bacterium]